MYQLGFQYKTQNPGTEKQNRDRLYTFIWGIPKNNNNCHLYPINGVEDHLHIFPEFNGWQEGYGGFTYSYDAKDRLIDYVKNQEEHHKTVTFKQEYKALLEEHGIEFYEKYVPWFNPLRGYFWWFFYPGLHPGLFMFNPFRIGLLILF